MQPPVEPRVYVSYSSESGAAQQVKLLVDWLRSEGVECLPDVVDVPPGADLTPWLDARSTATHVLAVASARDPESRWTGVGATRSGPPHLLFILFAPEDAGSVPPSLRRSVPVFDLSAEGGTEQLLHYISGQQAEPGTGGIPVQGPSTHIDSDVWTDRDAIGYRYYAYALYHFLTHARTRSGPLTISVQAPWGGGKTSLMRMVKRLLDPRPAGAGPESARERLTVESLLQGRRPDLPPHLPTPPDDRHRITVWFNAWKYQSTEQVWAGLADCIVREITDRLSPADREKFWLHLQWARIDADKVRRTVWNQVLSTFAGWFLGVPWWHLLSLGASALFAWVLHVRQVGAGPAVAGWTIALTDWAAALTVAELIHAGSQLTRALQQVRRRDIKVDFAAYVSAPDYSVRAGFIHHVADDLRKVLKLVPEAHKPVVVFVDDLDRCSPGKVAEVMEAINLFLAGDFTEFQFVIGMDTEMVAAALEVAHKEMVARLPDGAGDTPLGWRFMDKFVQLPFLLPPPEPSDCRAYLHSLFSDEPGSLVTKRAGPGEVKTSSMRPPQPELNPDEETAIRRQADRFNDQDEAVRDVLIAAALSFSDNPRELKRYVNLLRFYWYLRAARLARDLPGPTDGQMARWAACTLRWPQVTRWVHQGEPGERLRLLEEAAEVLRTRTDMVDVARAVLGLTPEQYPWVKDARLWAFLGAPDAEPLSPAAGLGLW